MLIKQNSVHPLKTGENKTSVKLYSGMIQQQKPKENT